MIKKNKILILTSIFAIAIMISSSAISALSISSSTELSEESKTADDPIQAVEREIAGSGGEDLAYKESKELSGTIETVNPPVGCDNCFQAAVLAINDAKEKLSDSFPRVKDYVDYGLTWYVYYLDDLTDWFTVNLQNTLDDSFDEYGFHPGVILVSAVSSALDYTFDVFYDLLQDPDLKHKVLATFLLPIFMIKLSIELINACFADGGQEAGSTEVGEAGAEIEGTVESTGTESQTAGSGSRSL